MQKIITNIVAVILLVLVAITVNGKVNVVTKETHEYDNFSCTHWQILGHTVAVNYE